MSSFDPGWPVASTVASSMVGQPTDTYQSPEITFGAPQTPSRNQISNSAIPSHTVAQQHQWNAGNHFPPSNPLPNNFRPPNLFDPQSGAQMVGGG